MTQPSLEPASYPDEPLWLTEFEQRKTMLIQKASDAQRELDPSDIFSSLEAAQKARLTKPLLRFFLMEHGLSCAGISCSKAMAVFDKGRGNAGLPHTQKLFSYFLEETKKILIKMFGIDIKEVERVVPSADLKRKYPAFKDRIFFVTSMLATDINLELMDKWEKQILGVMGVLVRAVLLNEGSMTKQAIINLLTQLDFTEGVPHPLFGSWETTIFEEAKQRRYLICSRKDPDVFEVGERAYVDMDPDNLPELFLRFPN